MQTSQKHFTTIVYTKMDRKGGGRGGKQSVNYVELENRE